MLCKYQSYYHLFMPLIIGLIQKNKKKIKNNCINCMTPSIKKEQAIEKNMQLFYFILVKQNKKQNKVFIQVNNITINKSFRSC